MQQSIKTHVSLVMQYLNIAKVREKIQQLDQKLIEINHEISITPETDTKYLESLKEGKSIIRAKLATFIELHSCFETKFY